MGSHKILLPILLFTWASLACLCFSLPCEYSILDHDLPNFPSEEVVVDLFRQWMEKHKKVYKDAEEVGKRFENFRNSLKFIIEKNAERTSPNGYCLGLNSFSDMSNKEFRQVYLSEMKQPFNLKGNTLISKNVEQNLQSCDSAPSSLDWRTYGIVTGVKYQAQCGSCWAFSSTGAIEGINALQTDTLISLSEQELVDCVRPGHGCRGAFMTEAFQWVINNGGIDTETDYPYTGVDGTCDSSKVQNKVVTIDGFQVVENSDDALFCAVAQQPVSVGMDASSTEFQHYQNGIFDTCIGTSKNHAVLIVGYNSTEDGEDYWIVKNSWGTNWGMQGYINIRRNATLQNGTCGINSLASYPTKGLLHAS